MFKKHRAAINAAKGLIQELYLDEPSDIDIRLIAAHLGVNVDYRFLPNEEGHLVRSGEYGTISVNRSAQDTNKWRFVIAHELGHFCLHEHLDQLHLCTELSLHDWYRKNGSEPEANAFASELLMPEEMFRPLCDINEPTIDDIRALSDKFQTSLTSTALRFAQFSPEPCAIVCSSNGCIDWWESSDDFAFTLKRGYQPTRGTVAGAIFSGGGTEEGELYLDGKEWSDDTRSYDLELVESSSKLGKYDSVLTLLWHPYLDDEE